jgi:hypothetical protein
MSITLTTPSQINTVLGGNTLVSYDHVVLSPINFSPVDLIISATIRLTASVNPEMDVVTGNLRISLSQGTLLLTIEQLDIVRKMQLSAGQITAIQTIINNTQDALEAGLVSVGVVEGTQSTGT